MYKLSNHQGIKVFQVQRDLSLYQSTRYKNSILDVDVIINGKEKLHGKMLFTDVYEGAGSASAKRKWTVTVPGSYLNIARQGNVAVVYQPYRYNKQEWASWILWISDLPL